MKLKTLVLGLACLTIVTGTGFVPKVGLVEIPAAFAQAQYGDDGYGSGEYGQDTIAPTLSAATDGETGQTTSNGSVTSNEGSGTLYWVVTTSASVPSAAQIKAGQDHTGASAVADGSQAVTVSGAQNTSATGLSANTAYFTHFMHEDGGTNQSAVISASGFTTDSSADTTAPNLSSPADTETGQTTANGSVSTNEANGTLYWVVTTSASVPSAVEVRSGQDHTGSAASAASSQIVASTGVQNTSATGLSANTAYFTHFMHEDASGNRSSVSTASGFTTDAIADTTAPMISSPTDSANGQSASNGQITTNEANGTLYWVVSTSPTPPNVTQIKSGQNNLGSSAAANGSQTVTSLGVVTVAATGLNADTAYFTHFMHEDASGNSSAISSASGFTTSAASSGSSSGGGGGGGGSSSSDYFDVISISALSTSVSIAGTVAEDDTENVFTVLSSEDSTPRCFNDGDDYIVATIAGQFNDGDTFTVTVNGLTADTEYYMLVCGEVDGRDRDSDRESFTTTASNQTTPAVTNPTTVPTPPSTPVTTSTGIPTGFSFDNNISFIQPSVNNPLDVQYLAQFLNDFEGESLAIDSTHSVLDDAAVKRFQQKYRREILDVWNLTNATGYVGITTRLKMNFLLKGQAAQCPAFVEFNGGRDGIFNSPEVAKTKEILRKLGMYNGVIDNNWTPQTNDAMVVFQETFREVMLDPWNITKGTGYKYKTTNKFLNYFAGCDTGAIELEGIGIYEGI